MTQLWHEQRKRLVDAGIAKGVPVRATQMLVREPDGTMLAPTVVEDVPCSFRGQEAGKIDCGCQGKPSAYICSNPAVDGWYCMLHAHPIRKPQIVRSNGVVIDLEKRRLPVCATCEYRRQDDNIVTESHPHYTPLQNSELRFIRNVDLARDAMRLVPTVPHDCRGVVGVPRSGMIPASLLATTLHLPLFELTKDGPRPLGAGSRGTFNVGDGPWYVVDDSTHNGGAMVRAKSHMRGKGPAIFAAVYALTDRTADVHAVVAPGPHLFEWNIWNNALIGGAAIDPRLRGGIAFDFDGVFCHDTPFAHTDAVEDEAVEWYRTAPLKYRATFAEIPLVVTFRLEKHRAVTEEWCRRWGVRIKRMVMHPAATFTERDRNFDVAAHKGETFKHSPCCLFIESDRNQAPIIAGHAGKPVIVPDTGEVFT